MKLFDLKKEFRLDDAQMVMLEGYMKRLLEYNEHINLTAIKDEESFIAKHYYDSLLCCDLDEYINSETVVDIGTGGGFPGIPLAVYSPDKEFVLIDSVKKKLRIIDELCEELGIRNVKTLHIRAEDAGRSKKLREYFDLCVSRAVADLSVLSELCLPLVKNGGCFISYKASGVEPECEKALKAIKAMGGESPQILTRNICVGDDHNNNDAAETTIETKTKTTTQTQTKTQIKAAGTTDTISEFLKPEELVERKLIVIHKIKNTPKKYPRKPGLPSKDPIR